MSSVQKDVAIVTERLGKILEEWDVKELVRDFADQNKPKGIVPVEIYVAILWRVHQNEIKDEIARRLAER